MLLVIPVLLAALIFGLLLGGSAYLIGRLIKGIPPLAEKVLGLLDKVRQGAKQASSAAASLVIEPLAALAIFRPKRDRQDPDISLND